MNWKMPCEQWGNTLSASAQLNLCQTVSHPCLETNYPCRFLEYFKDLEWSWYMMIYGGSTLKQKKWGRWAATRSPLARWRNLTFPRRAEKLIAAADENCNGWGSPKCCKSSISSDDGMAGWLFFVAKIRLNSGLVDDAVFVQQKTWGKVEIHEWIHVVDRILEIGPARWENWCVKPEVWSLARVALWWKTSLKLWCSKTMGQLVAIRMKLQVWICLNINITIWNIFVYTYIHTIWLVSCGFILNLWLLEYIYIYIYIMTVKICLAVVLMARRGVGKTLPSREIAAATPGGQLGQVDICQEMGYKKSCPFKNNQTIQKHFGSKPFFCRPSADMSATRIDVQAMNDVNKPKIPKTTKPDTVESTDFLIYAFTLFKTRRTRRKSMKQINKKINRLWGRQALVLDDQLSRELSFLLGRLAVLLAGLCGGPLVLMVLIFSYHPEILKEFFTMSFPEVVMPYTLAYLQENPFQNGMNVTCP